MPSHGEPSEKRKVEMPGKLEKTIFMLRKFSKDIRRGKTIYETAEDIHSSQLKEYYFLMDEEKLRGGYSQNFHFDEQGIPMIPTYIDVEERKLVYYPISIGQFGLAIFHTFLKTNAPEDRKRFMQIADWFYDNRLSDERLGDYWLTDVPKPEYKIFHPWPSAFAQGRAISILLRGYQLSGEKKYLGAANRALKIFSVPAAEGGVTSFTEFGPVYEEYPAPFLTAVLDGSIFSLFGLFDYIRAMEENGTAKQLFDKGIDALKKALPKYDLGFWIKYNLCSQPGYPQFDPATITYFRMINAQLQLLYRMSGDSFFREYAERWQKYDRLPNRARMYWLKYRALKKLNRL